MRIVYLGMNAIGKRVHDWLVETGEEIVALCLVAEDLAQVLNLRPDVIISGGFRHILPPDILALPRLGCINMHKSLLPWNRGANPNVWTIIEGSPAGVSIHLMDEGIDTGDVLAQAEVEIFPDDTAARLYKRMEEAQFDLFINFWHRFKQGEIVPVPQSALGDGSFHALRDFRALRRLDLNTIWTAGELITLLRAMTFPPFRNLYFEAGGRRYAVEISIEPMDAPREEGQRGTDGYLKQYGG